jgi:hypothetical protein
VPLRTLTPRQRLSGEHTTGLLGESHQDQSSRLSSDSDFSLLSNTSGLAEQPADEEDPLHATVKEAAGEERSDDTRGRQQSRGRSTPSGRAGNGNKAGVDKEAIEAPEPAPRKIGRAEQVIAVIMTGNKNASQMHGLTGKPLLFVATCTS